MASHDFSFYGKVIITVLFVQRIKIEEVINFLKNIKLEKYSDNFEEKGYDDFDFIKNMTQAQLTDMLEAVGMYEKPGHREKFLATLSILKSKSELRTSRIKSKQCRK